MNVKIPASFLMLTMGLSSCTEVVLSDKKGSGDDEDNGVAALKVDFINTSDSNNLIPLDNLYGTSDFYTYSDIDMLYYVTHPQYPGNPIDGCTLDFKLQLSNTGTGTLELSNYEVTRTTEDDSWNWSWVNLYPNDDVSLSLISAPTSIAAGQVGEVTARLTVSYCLLGEPGGSVHNTMESFAISFDSNDADNENFSVDFELYATWS